uniref:Uncharacterized protein n=1 Tax=viral metagenome TaxID=1070528 RepID=A0A6C0BDT1_9ZZZZ
MVKINLITKNAPPVEIRTLTTIEREIKYEQMAAQNKSIESYHFENLFEMENNELLSKPASRPTILNILLKECLAICDPVVDSLSPTGITTQISRPVCAVDINGKYSRMYSSNTPLNITGLYVRNNLINQHSYNNSITPLNNIIIYGHYGRFGYAGKYTFENLQNITLNKLQNSSLKNLSGGKRAKRKTEIIKKEEQFDRTNYIELNISNEPDCYNKLNTIYNKLLLLYTVYNTTSVSLSSKFIYNIVHKYLSGSSFDKFDEVKNRRELVKPDKEIADIIKLISPVSEVSLYYKGHIDFLICLYNYNIENLYYTALLNKSYVLELISIYDSMLKNRHKNIMQYYKGRLSSIEYYRRNALSKNKYNKTYSQLTKSEREIILHDIKKLDNLTKSTVFPIQIINQLNDPNRDVRVKAFKIATSGAIANAAKDIQLADVICAHKFETLTMESTNTPDYLIVKNIIGKYASMNINIGKPHHEVNMSELQVYFCGLCGEELAPVDYEQIMDKTLISTEMRLPIDKHIYTNVINIIKYNVYSRFMMMNNTVRDIVNSITTIIIDTEKRIMKNKGKTPDEINNEVTLYIHIYTYAVLIRMMENNKEIVFRSPEARTNERGDRNRGDRNREEKKEQPDEEINTNIFEKSDDVEELKDDTEKITKLKKMVDPKKLYVEEIRNANDENVVAFSKKIEMDIEGGATHPNATMELFATSLKFIFKTFKRQLAEYALDIAKIKLILVKAYNDVGEQRVDIPDAVKELINTFSYDFFYKMIADKNNRTYNDVTKNLKFASFTEITELPRGSSLFMNIEDTGGKDKVFDTLLAINKVAINSLAIPESDIYYEVNKELQEFVSNEREFNKDIYIANIPAVSTTKMASKYKHKHKNGKISNLYDIDGNRVDWDIFITNVGEIKRKDIANMFIDSKKNIKITDLKSSKTGSIKSKIDENKVRKGLEFNDSLISFYNYYTFKCPVSTIHNIDKEVCSKCKLNIQYISDKNIEYYNKWNKTYSRDFESDNKITGTISKIKTYNIGNVNNIKLNTESISNIANLYKIEYNRLYNLGLTEKYVYTDIETKTINPTELEKINHARALRLTEYYNFLIRVNKQLKYNRTRKLTPKLQDISNNAEKTDYKDFINIPQFKPLEYSLINTEATSLCNYLLMTIYSEIYKFTTLADKSKNVMKDFAKYCIDELLQFDLLYSIFSIAKLKYTKEQYAEELDDDENEVIEDEENANDALSDTGGVLDGFSMDDMDFEDNPDNLEANDMPES